MNPIWLSAEHVRLLNERVAGAPAVLDVCKRLAADACAGKLGMPRWQ